MGRRIEGIDEDDLRRMYDVEGMTEREIASYYGVSHRTIQERMKEYNIKPRLSSEVKRQYSINHDFFKSWTPESAWLYGWAIGDGNFTRKDYLHFRLSAIDKEVLFKFRDVLDSEHPVYDFLSHGHEMSRIQFNSITLVKDLKRLHYRDVPRQYFKYWLRGFFEAEGSVYWHKENHNSRGGSIHASIGQNDYEILDYILQTLRDEGVIKGGSIHKLKNTWLLKFGTRDSISLCRYIYSGYCKNIYLKRKKEKFEMLMERQLKGE